MTSSPIGDGAPASWPPSTVTTVAAVCSGDFAEYLFCAAYGWAQASNSEKGFDAIGNDGNQVKGRRITIRNSSRQLSAIRDLDGFDTFAAVLFDDLYRVVRAAMIDGRRAPPGSRHGSRVL